MRDQFDIILNIGQSNTHLGADGFTQYPEVNDQVYQLGRFGKDDMQVIEAEEPLQHFTAQENAFGFASTFSNLYVKYKLEGNRKVLIIPGAKSGSCFQNNDWNKGDFLYEDAVYRVKTVIQKYPGSKLACILWHQGESDFNNKNYQSQFDQFIEDIRASLNAQEVPFIVGGMVPFWVNQHASSQEIQQIIKSSPNRHSYLGYADPKFPFEITKENPAQNSIHYDAQGMIELGKRYYDQFEMISE